MKLSPFRGFGCFKRTNLRLAHFVGLPYLHRQLIAPVDHHWNTPLSYVCPRPTLAIRGVRRITSLLNPTHFGALSPVTAFRWMDAPHINWRRWAGPPRSKFTFLYNLFFGHFSPFLVQKTAIFVKLGFLLLLVRFTGSGVERKSARPGTVDEVLGFFGANLELFTSDSWFTLTWKITWNGKSRK